MALGDWTSAYHATPANTDVAGQGDDRIRELLARIRERAKIESDWGEASLEANYTDTGRANPGSARAFYSGTAPTRLRRFDNTADQPEASAVLGSGDNGRLWVNQTSAHNKLRVWAGTAFADVSAVVAHARVDGASSVSTGITDSLRDTQSFSSDTILLPDNVAGSWEVNAWARVFITKTGSGNALVQVRLRRRVGAGAYSTVDISEQTVVANGGVTRFLLTDFISGVGSTTQGIQYQVDAYHESGAGVSWGAASPGLNGQNRTHKLTLRLHPLF